MSLLKQLRLNQPNNSDLKPDLKSLVEPLQGIDRTIGTLLIIQRQTDKISYEEAIEIIRRLPSMSHNQKLRLAGALQD